jgi:hypothetical protein
VCIAATPIFPIIKIPYLGANVLVVALVTGVMVTYKHEYYYNKEEVSHFTGGATPNFSYLYTNFWTIGMQ